MAIGFAVIPYVFTRAISMLTSETNRSSTDRIIQAIKSQETLHNS